MVVRCAALRAELILAGFLMKRMFLLVLLHLLIIPVALSAQEPSPSDGISLPDPSLSTQSDSASLEVNPAGLGFIEGFEGAYGFSLPTSDYRGVMPSGHSLMLGAGGRSGGVGLGVQWMDNPELGPQRSTYQKYTFGGALASSRFFALGGNVNYFSSRRDERLNDLRTFDVGLQWRPSRFFGMGVMVRDVVPAFLDPDQALPMRVGTGFALRFFDGRLVLDTDFYSVQGSEALQYRPRIAAEPLAGLRLFGHAMVELPMPFRTSTIDPAFDGFSAGLEISTGGSGAQAALGEMGGSYRIWAGTRQKRSLFTIGERWVRLSLDETLTEQASVRLFGAPTRPFLSLINDINAISEDPAVSGVILDIGSFSLGYGQLWELHQAMDRLHESGKSSLALMHSSNTTTVYAASAAQEIWMVPTSPYAPTGLQVEFTSFAGLLDRMGIEAEFLRIGDYKSAPESLVMPGPSDPALEQTNEYLDALYDELTTRIGQGRDISDQEIRTIIDRTPLLPAQALDRGLVDALVYNDELEERLQERTGRLLGLDRGYQRVEIADKRWGGQPEIAIVYIDGTIVDGESGSTPLGSGGITGAETINRTLRRLRRDRSVKAVVVRVNSGGGSAVGSDLMFRELRHLATVKPVVASMGNVAASGGYYVAAGADEIFATPTTLTGSIGIFAGKVNIESLANRFGVNSQLETRGERAGGFSIWRPWSDSEKEGIAQAIDYFYQLFLQQVARTRPLTADEIDSVARGRVWTGAAAQNAQLVDQIGGLSDALQRAEELSGLQPGQAIYVDRTGAGGTTLSPGIAARFSTLLPRMGLETGEDLAIPDGEIPAALRELESSLLWPLYFNAGEVVFMPPFIISTD